MPEITPVSRSHPTPTPAPTPSVLISGPWLWVTYMHAEAPWGTNGCTDSGQQDGRPNDQITGCAVSGRVSRWSWVNGAIVGNEIVIVDGRKDFLFCAQFSTHSVTNARAWAGGGGGGGSGRAHLTPPSSTPHRSLRTQTATTW